MIFTGHNLCIWLKRFPYAPMAPLTVFGPVRFSATLSWGFFGFQSHADNWCTTEPRLHFSGTVDPALQQRWGQELIFAETKKSWSTEMYSYLNASNDRIVSFAWFVPSYASFRNSPVHPSLFCCLRAQMSCPSAVEAWMVLPAVAISPRNSYIDEGCYKYWDSIKKCYTWCFFSGRSNGDGFQTIGNDNNGWATCIKFKVNSPISSVISTWIDKCLEFHIQFTEFRR